MTIILKKFSYHQIHCYSRPSDKENRPSNFAAKYLKNRGYKIIPINPVTSKKTILGEKVYKTLSELDFIPDMVDLFVKKEKILKFVKEAIKIKTKTIWLQLGLIDKESEKIAIVQISIL